MRNKKLVSTVMASALVATTMAVPVMAADSGTVDVDVSTKSAVIRVEVPTSLEIAVDQFESVDAGAQIYSTPFTMKNKSGVGVKVGVTSTATVTGVSLVSTVKAVEDSTAATGEAWLAVAAKTAADSYGAEVGELTETSANVATFDGTTKEAEQTFYLEKGTGDVEYKMLYPAAAGKVGDVSYAQFYELTDKTNGIQGASAPATPQSELDDLLKASDVYVGTATAAEGNALAKVEKGSAHTYDASEFYYTAADAVTEAGNVKATTPYVYAGAKAAGGEAAFRYIGKLSENKTSAWTKDDISKVNIAYTIDGVTASVFDEAAQDCTYGLYTAPVAPSLVSAASVQVTSGQPVEIELALGAGSKKATKAVSMIWKEKNANIGTDPNVSYKDGVITLGAASIDNLLKDENNFPVTLSITFDDTEKTVVEVTLTK